ncbi:hypothetical protein BV898_08811 [Hypsibius exemplaris]|uniref:HTH CENPB-type domain-containing protein n=1 Tax=Hypsibius exemplaris TaxID=2072580 RepID=A0A1W0WPG3_HYPEX|nr:hypothetical protein BV898_08811 [Hypsibius exemplaris]
MELAIIHDLDLQKWAREASAEVGLDIFLVSSGWIQMFKHLSKFSDQKIIFYVTKKMVDNESDRYIAAANFINNVKELIA